jgi:hypothetical protein
MCVCLKFKQISLKLQVIIKQGIATMSFAIKIGNYRFSKNLGDGNFGKVKRNPFTLY